ncbi:MAG: hypothetical protein PHW76_03595 [Alphaproteobacteria bacterium]|nr:hypothetical protein [Alphaproteobacteria bacterium]
MSTILPLEITKEIPKRAFGRSLSDFRQEDATPNGLLPAEEKLLVAAGRGEPCQIDSECPARQTPANSVRGEFVRFLLLGGDGSAPVHENGVMLLGAYIDGSIDLHNVEDVAAFSLIACDIEGDVVGLDATLKSVCLTGTHVNGVVCDRARISGSVFLDGGFVAKEPVRFQGARVSGSLYCNGGTFHGKAASGVCDKGAEDALSIEGAEIGALILGGPACAGKMAVEGCLNFQNACVASFADDPASWPRESQLVANVIKLDGFIYNRFVGEAPLDTGTRIKWLKRQPKGHLYEDFRPQPFEQLEKVLHVMGRRAEARDICFLKDRYYIRSRYIGVRDNAETNALYRFLGFLWWRVVLRGGLEAASFGFRKLHVLTALVVALVIGSGFVYRSAAEQGLFAPTDATILFDPELRASCVPNCAEVAKSCSGPSKAPSAKLEPDANAVLVARSMWIGHNKQKFWPSFQYLTYAPRATACAETCKANWIGDTCNLKRFAPEYPSFSPFVYAVDVILPPGVGLKQASSWRVVESPDSGKGGTFIQALAWTEALIFWFWALSALGVLRNTLKRD